MRKVVIMLFTAALLSAAQNVTIEDIQGHQDDSPYAGQTVTTSGIVTGVYVNTTLRGFSLEMKPGGPWRGIFVYTGGYPTVGEGDSVMVTGGVSEYYGKTELSADSVYILQSNVQLPETMLVTTGSAQQEQYEGVLVQVVHAMCDSLPNSYGEWYMHDFSDTLLQADDLGFSANGQVVVGQRYNVTGFIDYSYGSYKIEPRYQADVTHDTSNIPPIVKILSVNPSMPESDQNPVVTAVVRDEDGTITADTLYTSLDTFTTIDTSFIPYNASGDTVNFLLPRYATGSVIYFFIKAYDDKGAITYSDTMQYLVDPGNQLIPISYLHILDNDGVSVFNGKTVTVCGIATVAGEFDKKYYIQDKTGGVVLYGPSGSIYKGDSIVATGIVDQYSGLVELSYPTTTSYGQGAPVSPKVLTISQLNTGGEKYEGMLVRINNVTTSSSYFPSNSTIDISDNSGTFTLYVDKNTNIAGKPIPGGQMDITGVISQYDRDVPYNSGYQIIPRSNADIEASGNGSGLVSFSPPFGHKNDTLALTIILRKDKSQLAAARFALNDYINSTDSITVENGQYTLDAQYHLTVYNISSDSVIIHIYGLYLPDTLDSIPIQVKTSTQDTLNLNETLQSPISFFVTTPIFDAQFPGSDGVTPQDSGEIKTLAGVVVGPNRLFSSEQTNLWIQDQTSGIEIYYSSPIQDFDTGDVVLVKGTITEYNGLTEISPSASEDIRKIGKVRAIQPATLNESQGISENMEGTLLKFKGEVAQAPYMAGSGYDLYVWNGTIPITVYVYTSTGINLNGIQAGDMLEVTGIASQYDSDAPYTDGYQLIPRFQSDVVKTQSQAGGSPSLSAIPNVVDKTNGEVVTINVAGPADAKYRLRLFDSRGRLIKDFYSGTFKMGPANAQWRLDDNRGAIVNMGLYILQLEVQSEDGKLTRINKTIVVTKPK